MASWASDQNCDWSIVVLNGIKKLSGNFCTVDELIKSLIMACLDLEQESYLKVAGRLYISDLYKKVTSAARVRL